MVGLSTWRIKSLRKAEYFWSSLATLISSPAAVSKSSLIKFWRSARISRRDLFVRVDLALGRVSLFLKFRIHCLFDLDLLGFALEYSLDVDGLLTDYFGLSGRLKPAETIHTFSMLNSSSAYSF